METWRSDVNELKIHVRDMSCLLLRNDKTHIMASTFSDRVSLLHTRMSWCQIYCCFVHVLSKDANEEATSNRAEYRRNLLQCLQRIACYRCDDNVNTLTTFLLLNLALSIVHNCRCYASATRPVSQPITSLFRHILSPKDRNRCRPT